MFSKNGLRGRGRVATRRLSQAQAYDFAVDWWALGVLLFTMLKGRLPFDAAEEDKMLWRIVKSKPRYDPARVPEWHRVVPTLRSMLQGGRRYYSVKRTAPANSDPAKIQPKRSPSLIGRRPQAWSQPTLDVLRALLQKRPATRLSTLRALGDAALYERMDWVKLEACQLPPPYPRPRRNPASAVATSTDYPRRGRGRRRRGRPPRTIRVAAAASPRPSSEEDRHRRTRTGTCRP